MPESTLPESNLPGSTGALDARSVGERIERLLEASAASGPLAVERSEELVRLVVTLYGAGLERLLELAYDAGALSDDLLEAIAVDPALSPLLLVHGLHPYSVEERVSRALDTVRPYMGSHGGDVEFLGITDEGAVLLRMLGSCDGCAATAVTLDHAVREAIEAAAPEITGIELEEPTKSASVDGVIPIESLSQRLRGGPHGVESESVLA
jgi:Fe-S cluster biogenesis protein NfuA